MTAKEILHELRERWLDGEPADVAALLDAHPKLREDRAAALAVIYEDFCLRRADGEAIDHEQFAARFPDFRTAVRDILSADRKFGEDPGMIDRGSPPPRHEAVELNPGEVVCGCLVGRWLGLGGAATVYLAHDPEGDRPVVLKVSREATGEGRVLGKLDHDNIVPLLWSRKDEARGLHVVCMPFAGAATLTHVLDRLYPRIASVPPKTGAALVAAVAACAAAGDPTPRAVAGPDLGGVPFAQAVARLGYGLASTLAYLHGQNLAHGDLKPSNLLLAAGGQPLLLDFHLAQGRNSSRVGGAAPYMAPEQLRAYLAGAPSGQEAASDVWALGVILYELLCGHHPFGAPAGERGVEQARDMLRLQADGHAPLRRRNPQVPARLARLIDRCMHPEPTRRPTAAVVAAGLRERPRRWSPLAWALALALASVALAAPQGGHEAAEHRAEDKQTTRAAAIKVAEQRYDALIKDNKHGEAYAQMAFARALRGDHAGAIDNASKAIKHRYEPPELLNNLAHSLMQLSRDEEAAAGHLDTALKANPKLAQAYFNRAKWTYRLSIKAQDTLPARVGEDLEKAMKLLGRPVDAQSIPRLIYTRYASQAAGAEADRFRKEAERYNALPFVRDKDWEAYLVAPPPANAQ